MLRDEEKLVFAAFLRTVPNFVDSPIERWESGQDPPDVLCIEKWGRRIGVELANWLDEEQMAASIERERLEHSYLEAIRSEEVAPPENIGLVWLSERLDTRLQQIDAESFRKELFELINEIDHQWFSNEDRDNPQGVFIRRFPNHSCLERHLQLLTIYSRKDFDTMLGFRWIDFPMTGGAYTPDTMVEALLEILRKKSLKYANLHREQGLEELHLVIYYNKALFHNTPFLAPDFGFREVADLAAQEARESHGNFEKIFLFNATGQEHEREAIQLWP